MTPPVLPHADRSIDPCDTSIPQRPAVSISTKSRKDDSKIIDSHLLVPNGYPPLESPIDVTIPLHFFDVDIQWCVEEEPLYQAMESLITIIEQQCTELKDPIHVCIMYGYPESHRGTRGNVKVFAIVDGRKKGLLQRRWKDIDFERNGLPEEPSSLAYDRHHCSSQQPPLREVASQPAEENGTFLDIRLRVPNVYPPVEKTVDPFLPFHFSWTSVADIVDENDPLVGDLEVVAADINQAFSQCEPPIMLMVIYGRVNEDDEAQWTRTDRDEMPSTLPYYIRHPKVLAICAEPNQVHRLWQAAVPIVRSALDRRFGGQTPVPIRYYYRRWDGPLNPPSPSPSAPVAVELIWDLLFVETMMSVNKDLITGEGHTAKTRTRDLWPVSVTLNMGYPAGRQDGVRKLSSNGTIGFYIKVRDPKGLLRPEIFGVTTHHSFTSYVGNVLLPPPSGKDELSSASHAEIAHQPTRDFQNTRQSYSERATNLEVSAAIFDNEVRYGTVPKNDLRWQTNAWVKQEHQKDLQVLAVHEDQGQKVIGTLWASSGREIRNVPSHFTTENSNSHDNNWLADWAVVKMSNDCKGRNIVSIYTFDLLNMNNG
ncbi:MAG: hypothetical protein Q9221_008826 [Calogaya cf. arnoldii]